MRRKALLIAAALGNTVEWFDFAVYGYLPTPLAQRSSRLIGLRCRW